MARLAKRFSMCSNQIFRRALLLLVWNDGKDAMAVICFESWMDCVSGVGEQSLAMLCFTAYGTSNEGDHWESYNMRSSTAEGLDFPLYDIDDGSREGGESS